MQETKHSFLARGHERISLDGDTRSAEILREAAKLFADKGYLGTSTQDIASAVGISKGSLYYFFSSKQEIHSLVIEMSVIRLNELVREKLVGCTTAASRVEGFARAHAQHIAENIHVYLAAAVGFNQLTDEQVKMRVLRMRDGYEERLRGIIRDGIEAGEFRELDVRLAARAIISCLNWMARWWRPTGPDSTEKIASDYVQLIIRGFLPD